jgi:multidrug resistance efflux pump
MRIAILVILFALQTGPRGNRPIGVLSNYAAKSAKILFVPPKMVKLYFNCNGVLGRIYVRKGNRFKKGDLLASLKYEDVNAPTISAAFYRNQAREARVDQPERLKKNLANAEADYEKQIAANRCYYLRADHNGLVVKEALKEGDLVSAGETILIVR